jgi:RND family efflux transporter MFP subunit
LTQKKCQRDDKMMRFATLAFACLLLFPYAVTAAEYQIVLREFPIMKSVFGQVQSRDIVPARARIGGTIAKIAVEAGNAVTAGETIANVVDQKLALQLEAIKARKSALSAQLESARTNLERAEQLFSQGIVAKTRLDDAKTQFDVINNQVNSIEAEKAVIVQQAEEGIVTAPSTGRVLSVPVTEGSVILPGEPVARIAVGGYFLRLSLPERHAAGIAEGDTVVVGTRGILPGEGSAKSLSGVVAKVYPEIVEGRVTADVEVEGLGDFFVGERTLVSIPIGTRSAIAVPSGAIATRNGLDYVTIIENGQPADVTVIPGEVVANGDAGLTEILSGLHPGDMVIVP